MLTSSSPSSGIRCETQVRDAQRLKCELPVCTTPGAWRVWPSAHAPHNSCVQLSQVWSLSSVYNRKKVYNSIFTHTLSSHLALGRTRRGRGPAETLRPKLPNPTPVTAPPPLRRRSVRLRGHRTRLLRCIKHNVFEQRAPSLTKAAPISPIYTIHLWSYMLSGTGGSPPPATPLLASDAALLWRESCDLDDDARACSDGCTPTAGEPSATWLQQPMGMPAPAGSGQRAVGSEPINCGAAPGGGGVISRRRESPPSAPPTAPPLPSRKLPSRRDC